MRNKILFVLSAAFVAGTYFSGCDMLDKKTVTNSEDKVQEAKENVAAAKMEWNKAIDQFKLESDKAIALNEKRIEELKLKSADEKAENKANYDKQVAALESKNHELKMKLTNYKEDNNWEAFKVEFNHDMKELGEAFGDLTVNNVN